MSTLKIIEEYDGRLPVFNVIKEVPECNNCSVKDVLIKSFDSYEEANSFCNQLINEEKVKDDFTPCGEEGPGE